MPGIVGILGRKGDKRNCALVKDMVRRMMHEPFYVSGTYENEDLGAWIGWVCHKGSMSDCQPVWNELGDVCLIVVGEEYTDPEEIRGLQAAGHSFDATKKDFSYLVHLYEEYGLAFLERLNGCFNGVLLDFRQKVAVLFNDRYGLVRTYYHENAQGLFFASEAKALLGVLPETRSIDSRGFAEFLSLGCVLQNRTLFTGISLLPSASAWRHAPGRQLVRDTYFDRKAWEEQTSLSVGQYQYQLKEIWSRILPRYFRGNEDVALSMTGGVDSRMILAWARSPPGSLRCYTFSGRYRECIDVKLAREAANLCGQPHDVLSVGADFLSKFPSLAEKAVYVSDGAMDVTGSIDAYIQTLARQVAPVRLSGVNGGEILRGIVAFKPEPLMSGLLSPELEPLLRQAAATYSTELHGNRLSFVAFKQTPWFMTAKFAVEHSQLTFRTPYVDNELVKLAYRTPPELAGSVGPALQLIADGNPAMEALGTDRGLALKSIPGISRVNNLLQEFTFRAEYAYDYGMPQWLARIDHLLAPLHLERLFLGRHKFHHFRVFYRDELSTYVRDILLDARSRTRPYLDGRTLERMVDCHIRGEYNYTREIHKALSYELMHRLLIEQH